jgi:hypothetical protein
MFSNEIASHYHVRKGRIREIKKCVRYDHNRHKIVRVNRIGTIIDNSDRKTIWLLNKYFRRIGIQLLTR